MGLLISGGAGYIGGHAACAAVDAGRKVVVLDDLSTGCRSAVPPGAAFVEGSINDAELVERTLRAHGVTEVLHFAALTQAPESLRSPLAYYQVNVAWSCALIAACIRAGVQAFVLSSTAAVYGEAGDRPISEADPIAPTTPYGASKAMAERMLQDAARASGLRYAILRYFNVAGFDPLGRASPASAGARHLVRAACEAVLDGRPLALYGDDYPTHDGSGVRDLVHVNDIAAAHLQALDALRSRRALTLNLGSGRGWSVLEVAEAVGRLSGAPLPVVRQPRRPGDLAVAVADPSRAAGEIGWRAHFGLDDMVAHTLAALRRSRTAGQPRAAVGAPLHA